MADPFFPPNTFPPSPYSQYRPQPPHHQAWSYSPQVHGFPAASARAFPYPPPPPAHWPRGPVPARGWRGGNRRRGWSDRQQNGGIVFECKQCDKQYKTKENYAIHLQSHVKCSNCEFEATAKALKEHQLVHFLPDELKFTSEEDVRKWREERKKNYPTAENVAKKKQVAMEKKERGELAVTPLHRYIQRIIGEDGSRFPRGGKRGRGYRGGRGRSCNQRDYQRQGPNTKQDPSSNKPAQDSITEQESKDDVESQTQENIMGAILADCDVHSSGSMAESSSSSANEYSIRSFSKKQKLESTRKKKWASRRQCKRATVGLEAAQGPRKPTLLEKLLTPEIRREENALLQCIRHITTNNFFTTEQPIKAALTSTQDMLQSCDNSESSHDMLPDCQSCNSPVATNRHFFGHSSKCSEPTPQSPDKPISSFEPIDRSQVL